jgi:hypothetical protein
MAEKGGESKGRLEFKTPQKSPPAKGGFSVAVICWGGKGNYRAIRQNCSVMDSLQVESPERGPAAWFAPLPAALPRQVQVLRVLALPPLAQVLSWYSA